MTNVERSRTLAWKMHCDILEMIHAMYASHTGAAYSCVDVIAVLYSGATCVYPNDPRNLSRDRIVLSKEHAGGAIYSALAECGFSSKEWLSSYYADNSLLSGHVCHKGVPGVEFSTGLLGQGVCAACGMALVAKMGNQPHHVWAIVGDGECEGGGYLGDGAICR